MKEEYEDVFLFYKGEYPNEEDVKIFSLEKCIHLSIVDDINVIHYYHYEWEKYSENATNKSYYENYWVIKFLLKT